MSRNDESSSHRDSGVWVLPEWHVQWEESVPSTMDRAREAAREGAPAGTVFAAREQTAGRGRTGRSWSSPPGGLYASLIVRDPPGEWAPLLPLVGAAAVRQGLAGRVADVEFRVKWPNDVLAAKGEHAGKVAGVLTEATASGAKIAWVIVGFGVNLDVGDDALPQEVDPPAVGLPGLGGSVPPGDEALAAILDAFAGLLSRYGDGPEGFVRQVDEVLAMRGQKVRGMRRGEREDLVGVLEGIDPSGDALVRTEEGTVRLAAWDTKRLRAA